MHSPSSPAIGTKIGAQAWSNAALPVGTTVIVSAAANTRGIVVRTATADSGGGSGRYSFTAGGTAFMQATAVGGSGMNGITWMGPPLVIPAGVELAIVTTGLNFVGAATWDVL